MVTEANDLGIDKLPLLGAMIEMPAAALCAKEISEHADFLSIGTNDLSNVRPKMVVVVGERRLPAELGNSRQLLIHIIMLSRLWLARRQLR